MHGLHLTADLRGCDLGVAAFTDAVALRDLCLREAQAAGLTPVGELFHPFGVGHGVTGVVLLAESHVAVHTWPERASVTVDVYVCNYGGDNSLKAHRLMGALVGAFSPARVQRHAIERGQP